jgi:hypothetical protein
MLLEAEIDATSTGEAVGNILDVMFYMHFMSFYSTRLIFEFMNHQCDFDNICHRV